jgi:DNA repair photolyase
MPGEQLFEIARRTFDTPEFRGIECIEVEAKSIINKVPAASQVPFDYTINPYRGCSHACVYCFARPTHTYLDMNAGRDFETKIVVKVNAPDVLRRELGAKRWKGDHIAMGTNTDPYQRVEGRYRLMRGILEALIDHRNPFSILTKGTLITRDVDLLVRAAEHAPVSAAFSIGTLDEDVWRDTEPGTPNPKARIEALSALVDAGIPTGVLIAPILPGLSDRPDQLRAVVEAALDAGASSVSPIMLHLRRGVREEFMPWLREHHPDLVERYERTYRTPYGPKDARETLSRRVRSYAAGRTGKLERTVAGRFGHRAADRRSGAPVPPEPEQLSMWAGPSGQGRSATPGSSNGAGRPR